MNYQTIKSISYYTNSTYLTREERKSLIKGFKTANKTNVNRLIRIPCQSVYSVLELNFSNPYGYFYTTNYFILVTNEKEYYFKINY